MGELILRDILLVFLVTVPVVLLLRLVRLPPIVGFILTGTLIGPSGFKLIHEAEQINILADVGVTLLLFAIGLEFSLAHFARHRTSVMTGGFLQIVFCIVAGALIGRFASWPMEQGIYFGCIIALSSTAVVLGSLISRRLHDSVPGRVATGILILQDLAVVPMMAFLPLLGRSGSFEAVGAIVGKKLAVLLLLGLVVFLFIRRLAGPLLRRISGAKSREVFLITIIVFALGLAWLTDRFGLSFALGAFLGGLIVGSTEYQVEALSEIRPLRYGFNALFFVSIGMLVDLPYVAGHAGHVLFFCLLIPGIKMALLAGILLILKVPPAMAIGAGIMLGRIGE
ncbi:MAG: cation:proton antiporter [Deltaproteobacteria bacterium]|nr:cation:proton antiporter [Deltaproteobacteria bacterium]